MFLSKEYGFKKRSGPESKLHRIESPKNEYSFMFPIVSLESIEICATDDNEENKYIRLTEQA